MLPKINLATLSFHPEQYLRFAQSPKTFMLTELGWDLLDRSPGPMLPAHHTIPRWLSGKESAC